MENTLLDDRVSGKGFIGSWGPELAGVCLTAVGLVFGAASRCRYLDSWIA
jgi:hypothetical protein